MLICPVKINNPNNIPNAWIEEVIFFNVNEVYPMNIGVEFLIFLSWPIIM